MISEEVQKKQSKSYRDTNPKASFYACLYADLRLKALECGYALALHGSMARDMDMIAVAWTDNAAHPDELMEKLLEAAGATIFSTLYPKRREKPHGRICYTLSIMGDWFIDLSVIPPNGQMSREYPQIRWIGQEDSHGCGAAVLAMVTGKTYAEVKSYFKHDFTSEGITQFELDDYLTAHGFAVARRFAYDNAKREPRADEWKTWRPAPYGDVHICQVSTVSGGHYVVMLADGTILDPENNQVGSLDDGYYFCINWIAAVVPV